MERLPSIKELRRICQPKDMDITFLATAYRYISTYITKLLLYTPITPNQITLLGMLIYMGGATLFISGSPVMIITGGLIVRFAILLDYVDGSVARYRGTTSLGGAFLDKLSDCVPQIFLFIFLSIGVYQNHPHILAFAVGCVAVMAIILKTLTELCQGSIIPKSRRLSSSLWPFHTVDYFIVAAMLDLVLAWSFPFSIMLATLTLYGTFSFVSAVVRIVWIVQAGGRIGK